MHTLSLQPTPCGAVTSSSQAHSRPVFIGRSPANQIPPILANVYLHYVLDLWFQKKWRARKATGDTIIVRYYTPMTSSLAANARRMRNSFSTTSGRG